MVRDRTGRANQPGEPRRAAKTQMVQNRKAVLFYVRSRKYDPDKGTERQGMTEDGGWRRNGIGILYLSGSYPWSKLRGWNKASGA